MICATVWIWAHPAGLVRVGLPEDGVRDGEVALCTFAQQEKAFAVLLANAVLPQYSLPSAALAADTGVEVSQQN